MLVILPNIWRAKVGPNSVRPRPSAARPYILVAAPPRCAAIELLVNWESRKAAASRPHSTVLRARVSQCVHRNSGQASRMILRRSRFGLRSRSYRFSFLRLPSVLLLNPPANEFGPGKSGSFAGQSSRPHSKVLRTGASADYTDFGRSICAIGGICG